MSMFTKKWSALLLERSALYQLFKAQHSLPASEEDGHSHTTRGRYWLLWQDFGKKHFSASAFINYFLKIFCYVPPNTNLPNVWHHTTHSRKYFDLSCHPFKQPDRAWACQIIVNSLGETSTFLPQHYIDINIFYVHHVRKSIEIQFQTSLQP